MEQLQKVFDLKDKIFKKNLSKQESAIVAKIYFDYFGIQLRTGCGTCLIEAYFELKNLTKEKLEQMKNRLFKIKEGEVLGMHGMAESYTNANLTNRGALTVLKLNRGCIRLFTAFPENWEALATSFNLRMTEQEADALCAGTKYESPKQAENENPVLVQLETMDYALLKDKALELGLPKKELKGKGRIELVQFIYDKIKE